MSQVFYNPEKQIYEVNAPEGKIATYFVFPPTLQTGDKLPPLYIHAWDQDVLFKFDGDYNAETDNLEFFIEGPIGYIYKISLQVDLPEQTYAWKIKRHGHTNIGRSNGATRLFVPRALCLSSSTLLDSELEVVKRWSFYGCSVPQQFGRLRLKVALFPARCAENPDNNYPRGSKGLYAYFDKEEGGQKQQQQQHQEQQQQQQEQQRDQSGTAGHPRHKHRAPSPVKGYSRARMLSSPRKFPGPPTHLSSPRLSEDSDAPVGRHRQQCCCFLAELPHEHNGTCGNHVHRMVSTCLQDDDGLKLLDDSVALDQLDACCATGVSFGLGPLTSSAKDCGAKMADGANGGICATNGGGGGGASSNHASIALVDYFPRKVRDLFSAACVSRRDADAATGRATSTSPKVVPRVTKNYNQNFSFAKIKVGYEDQEGCPPSAPSASAAKKSPLLHGVARQVARCAKGTAGLSPSARGLGDSLGKGGKCVHVHVRHDDDADTNKGEAESTDNPGVIKIQVPD